MNKEEKQGVYEVLKKYKRTKKDVAVSYLKKVRTGAIVGVGLDLVFTAGFGTLAAITTAAYPALKAAFRSAAKHGVLTRNEHQQQIKAGADAMIILSDIGYTLSAAFGQAAKNPVKDASIETVGKSLVEKAEFLKLADELETDVRKLEPSIKIVNGGKNNLGTDKYQILLFEQWAVKTSKFHTLDEARKIILDQTPPLMKQLEELKLAAKKAAEPPPPKKRGFNI